MGWIAPLREIGSSLWIAAGAGDIGGGPGVAEPGGRRGAAYVLVQLLAMAVVFGAAAGLKALLLPRVDPAYLAVLGAFVLTVPLVLHWLSAPVHRGVGLAAGLLAGAGMVALAWFALTPVVGPTWSAYLVTVVGFLAAGTVFGAVAPARTASANGVR